MGKNQSAAYAGQIFDTATLKWVPLCDKVAEIEKVAIPSSGDVVHTITLQEGRASAANTTDKFTFGPGSEPANLIFVPSLNSLGFSPDTYELKAIVQANVRTNAPPQDASIALFDSAGNQVDGSQVSGTLSAVANTDNVITSNAVNVSGGLGYAVNARLITAGTTENVVLQSATLIVQVLKK